MAIDRIYFKDYTDGPRFVLLCFGYVPNDFSHIPRIASLAPGKSNNSSNDVRLKTYGQMVHLNLPEVHNKAKQTRRFSVFYDTSCIY